MTGPAAACFISATVTATGVVSVGIAAGSTSVIVNVDDCDFEAHGAAPAGPLSFATSPETRQHRRRRSAAGPGAFQQTLPIQATANNHILGEVVSQTGVANCNGGVIGVAATVTGRLDLTGTVGDERLPGREQPDRHGRHCHPDDAWRWASTTDGLPSGSVVTFTLPAGIQYLRRPDRRLRRRHHRARDVRPVLRSQQLLAYHDRRVDRRLVHHHLGIPSRRRGDGRRSAPP